MKQRFKTEELEFIDEPKLEEYKPKRFKTEQLEFIDEPVSPGAQEKISPIESAARGAIGGATFGLGEELVGGVAGIGANVLDQDPETIVKAYQETRDRIRQRNKEAERQNPKSYLAGNIAGSITSPSLGTGLIKSGILSGAATGFGESESDESSDVIRDITSGGAVGGAVGSAFKGIGKAIEPIKEAGKSLVRKYSPALGSYATGIDKEVIREAVKHPDYLNNVPVQYEEGQKYKNALKHITELSTGGGAKARQALKTEKPYLSKSEAISLLEKSKMSSGREDAIEANKYIDKKIDEIRNWTPEGKSIPKVKTESKFKLLDQYGKPIATQSKRIETAEELYPDIDTQFIKDISQDIGERAYKTNANYVPVDERVTREAYRNLESPLRESENYAEEVGKSSKYKQLLDKAKKLYHEDTGIERATRKLKDKENQAIPTKRILNEVDESLTKEGVPSNFYENQEKILLNEALSKNKTQGSRRVNQFANIGESALGWIPAVGKPAGRAIGSTLGYGIDASGNKLLRSAIINSASATSKGIKAANGDPTRIQKILEPIMAGLKSKDPQSILVYQLVSKINPEIKSYIQTPLGSDNTINEQ